MPETPHQPAADEQDASMDTILASIRRIIMEDEAVQPPPGGAPSADADDDLLVLQPSMIVEHDTARDADMAELLPRHQAGRDAQSAADLAAALFDVPEIVTPPPPLPSRAVEPEAPPPMPVPMPVSVPVPVLASVPTPDPIPVSPRDAPEPLLAPSASLAAAQALASLQQAIRPEPPPSDLRLLRSGGPTIEDMVREELRGQLKSWLDHNLPPLVERLVAQEIGRLVGRG